MSDRGFTETVRNLYLDAQRGGPMQGADGEGWAGNVEASRFMRVQVRLQDNLVAEARFGAPGCAPAIACGEWVARWVCGRSFEEVSRLTASDVLTALGGLPAHRRYYAALTVQALQNAVQNALRGRS